MKYRGISYPPILCFKPILWLWKKLCCRRNWHLFDEVETLGSPASAPDHYLVCDACDLVVNIHSIDDLLCREDDDEPEDDTPKKGIMVLADGDGWCENCGHRLTKSGGCTICRTGPPLSEKDYL